MDTAALYRRFAEREAHGYSPAYERLSVLIAEDSALLATIDSLPRQQPNLVLAAARYLGAPLDTDGFRQWVPVHAADLAEVVAERRTQTNEVARCAVLLPVLAAIGGPLALIEVGASAGVCLYPDKYRYSYDGRPAIGDGPLTLYCRTNGRVPLPSRVPEVAWRCGLDLNPLDVQNPDDLHWLETLVWPEQTARLARLRAAASVVASSPPVLLRGDLTEGVDEVLARVPEGTTPVVFHSAVLSYVDEEARTAFRERMRAAENVRWISNESPGVFPDVAPHVPDGELKFVLALDGKPLALTGPHGQSIDWL